MEPLVPTPDYLTSLAFYEGAEGTRVQNSIELPTPSRELPGIKAGLIKIKPIQKKTKSTYIPNIRQNPRGGDLE